MYNPAPELQLDMTLVVPVLRRFIKREVAKAGLSGIIAGVSGGVDSACVVGLAAGAVGPENVTGMWLPYHDDSDAVYARAVAERFGIKFSEFSIAPMADAYLAQVGEVDDMRRGNLCARARMIALFDHSRARNALVCGTGNKTEFLLGYFTIFGDGACSLAPVADLYKGQVYQLAAHLGVPRDIIERAPTAGLWPGQTDEEELGLSYEEVDRYLYYLVEKGETPEQLKARGFEGPFQRRVVGHINRNLFKRKLPVLARVSGKMVTKPIELPEGL
ncbi:MAG: NAD+ synthase [Candidatus Zixiibacteriota bacterium]|jgi:NAD+ synthase